MFAYLTSYNAGVIYIMLNEECSYPCQNSEAISSDIVSHVQKCDNVRKQVKSSSIFILISFFQLSVLLQGIKLYVNMLYENHGSTLPWMIVRVPFIVKRLMHVSTIYLAIMYP